MNPELQNKTAVCPKSLVIAMVTDDFFPAKTGVGIHVQKIAPELVLRGHKVIVITSRRRGQPQSEIWNGVQIYRFFSLSVVGFYQALPSSTTLIKVLSENNVDIIHLHYLSLMMIGAMKAARFLKIPTVFTAHMTIDVITQPPFMKPFHGLFVWLYKRAMQSIKKIICVSSQQKQEFDPSKTEVISNPVDFRGDEAQDTTRPDRFVVLYVGRLEQKKNVRFLVDAFKSLVERHPDSELRIAGKGVEEKALRAQVQALGIANKVSFLGQVSHSNLPALYTSSDVFVLPSLLETQGLVVLEAIRFRRPVIVTNAISSAGEMVKDGVNGFIVDPNSVQDLSDKLCFLHDNPTDRRKMGEMGFDRFPAETTQDIAAKLEAVYRSTMVPRPLSRITLETCAVCGHKDIPIDSALVRSNIRRYHDQQFQMWRCSHCLSIHSEKVENLAAYYEGYPMWNGQLDYFTRVWYRVFLKRLILAGLKKEHRILDYGCGTGLFLNYLKSCGYKNCFGFDPYVEQFRNESTLEQKYDWVIGIDVIEHDTDPQDFVARLARLLNSTGRLCLETPSADGIDLKNPEKFVHSLHAPYHVHIFSRKGMTDLCAKEKLELIAFYDTYFMDSWLPGTSWSFIETLIQFGGNDFDVVFEDQPVSRFIKHPSLIFKFFFGYFFPKKKAEMMLIFGLMQTVLDPKQTINKAVLHRPMKRSRFSKIKVFFVKLLADLMPYFPLPEEWYRKILVKDCEKRYSTGDWNYLNAIEESHRYSLIIGALEMLAPKNKEILDVGCGEGILQKRISYDRYVGVDMNAIGIQTAKSRENNVTEFILSPAETFSPKGTFHAIIFNESLYYIQNPLDVFNKYKTYLAKDGIIIVCMFRTCLARKIWKGIERTNVSEITSATVTSEWGFSSDMRVYSVV